MGGSKSAKGGLNPLADMDRGVQILGGSKSAVTPANYRPTYLLSIPSKILESEANDNIVQHVLRSLLTIFHQQ